MNPHSILSWMSRNSLLKTGAISEVEVTATELESTIAQFINELSTISPNWQNDWTDLWALICSVHLTVSYYHVTYAFQSESTGYICLNVKELLVRTRRDTWSLSDYNATRTHNHLVRKGKLKHLAKLTKQMSWIVSTYLYSAFDIMFSLYLVLVWEWIHTLYWPECQGTFCSKQALYLKFNWLQEDSNHKHLVPKQTLKHLAKLTKWFSWVVSTYMYGAFDCIFLLCHVRVRYWTHTLFWPECQETLCSKQAPYLKFEQLQRDSNPQQLNS